MKIQISEFCQPSTWFGIVSDLSYVHSISETNTNIGCASFYTRFRVERTEPPLTSYYIHEFYNLRTEFGPIL